MLHLHPREGEGVLQPVLPVLLWVGVEHHVVHLTWEEHKQTYVYTRFSTLYYQCSVLRLELYSFYTPQNQSMIRTPTDMLPTAK